MSLQGHFANSLVRGLTGCMLLSSCAQTNLKAASTAREIATACGKTLAKENMVRGPVHFG
eukprot:CAMPEP_0172721394 /NCGR_PEP_ID=MMETSP1074-20121228/79028_1 /TAXON_ID=2916 /ORGANISM="Ceratium fusus, Strain PA161109" /LENGTH=59 /DNA_ID=CAMNT_0013547125 /DNA_START=33 /DNA_END=208 /DNA_ORIENTATION=-